MPMERCTTCGRVLPINKECENGCKAKEPTENEAWSCRA